MVGLHGPGGLGFGSGVLCSWLHLFSLPGADGEFAGLAGTVAQATPSPLLYLEEIIFYLGFIRNPPSMEELEI